MIRTTIRKVIEGATGLDPLLKAKLPVKAKYSVSRLASACQAEIERYHKEREKIFTEAGCVAGEKVYTHDDPEVLKKATAEADELLGAEVEISALPLDLEQFKDAEIEGPAFFGLEWAMKAAEPA